MFHGADGSPYLSLCFLSACTWRRFKAKRGGHHEVDTSYTIYGESGDTTPHYGGSMRSLKLIVYCIQTLYSLRNALAIAITICWSQSVNGFASELLDAQDTVNNS